MLPCLKSVSVQHAADLLSYLIILIFGCCVSQALLFAEPTITVTMATTNHFARS